MLLKNVDYDALHFHTGLLKINIFKVLFWEGGRGSQKKSTSVYTFDDVDNYGRPLIWIILYRLYLLHCLSIYINGLSQYIVYLSSTFAVVYLFL